jgi:hypothetical protein
MSSVDYLERCFDSQPNSIESTWYFSRDCGCGLKSGPATPADHEDILDHADAKSSAGV